MNNTGFTEICYYQGSVYSREVFPSDTTVYSDTVIARVDHSDIEHDKKVADFIKMGEECVDYEDDEFFFDDLEFNVLLDKTYPDHY